MHSQEHKGPPPNQGQGEGSPFVGHRAVFEAAPDALLIVDEGGVIRDANRQAAHLFGYERSELLDTPVERLVPPEVRDRHEAFRRDYMASPRTRPMGVGLQLRAFRKDGRQVPVEISLSPFESSSGRFVVAAVRDVTERDRLRRLGTGTLRAAEAERRRIARELHDDTAQSLAALLVRLRVLRGTEDPEARSRVLDEMQEALSGAVEGVRRISRGLRPPALEDVGVEAAIRAHLRDLAERDSLHVDADVEPVGRLLDPEEELVLYRVVQEAITNVIRHAGARTVRVSVSRRGDEIVARIQDDGRGFDADEVLLAGRGLGLVGMDERARLAGGSLSISSDPGSGTEVVLRIPVGGEVVRE